MTLGLAGGLSLLLVPRPASADQPLEWARIDFLRNRVQLVPRQERARRARIADVLSTGDALRTARSSRAELRFSDGSLARIGERATFRFTPNTRNFQLTNGTVLLLIPPERGRSTIQTPNAVTGIQGSALFVRYIPETDTTIVGALTNNPDGPMVLFNRDGTEQQALRANEIGVIQGDQITQLYQFDGELFWQSSGLAEGFNYLNDSSSTGSDALDAVRQEIRDAISDQRPLDGEGVIENPGSFSRPLADEAPSTLVEPAVGEDPNIDGEFGDDFPDAEVEEETPLEFEDSPAAEYLNSANIESEDRNSLEPAANPDALDGEEPAETAVSDSEDVLVDEEVEDDDVVTQSESETLTQDDQPTVLPVGEGEETAGSADSMDSIDGSETVDSIDGSETPAESETPAVVESPTTAPNAAPTAVMDSEDNAGNQDVDTDALSGDVDGVDVGSDGLPSTGASDPGSLPGEGAGQAVEDIPGGTTGGENNNPPGDTAVDIPGNTDGLILPEEDVVSPIDAPVDSDVVPITTPDEGGGSGINNPADVEGLSDDAIQQELVEITIPETGGVAADVPPVNDLPDAPPDNDLPNNVLDNDTMIGADVTEPMMTPVQEVTAPLDSIETPVGGLSAEPLPQELDFTNVPLVAPMDEMMDESMGGSMGNGMDDMTDTSDAMGEGTPDAGNSMPEIPGTVTVPSNDTPPDTTPPDTTPTDNTPPDTTPPDTIPTDNTPPDTTPPDSGTDTPDTGTPDSGETPETPDVPRGTV